MKVTVHSDGHDEPEIPQFYQPPAYGQSLFIDDWQVFITDQTTEIWVEMDVVTCIPGPVCDPLNIQLDEPSSHLDMKSTKKIEQYLLKKKTSLKIIMVTHDLFQAKRLADEIIFINEGKIIEISPKKKFLNSPNKIVQKFLDGGLF